MKLNSEQSHSLGVHNTEARLRVEALNGDILFVVTPATVVVVPTAAAFTRLVDVEVQNADGEVHTWFNESIASGMSIADTSTAGTASITTGDGTTLIFVKGRVRIEVAGDAAAWLNAETDTLTIEAYTGFAGQTLAEKTSVETFTT